MKLFITDIDVDDRSLLEKAAEETERIFSRTAASLDTTVESLDRDSVDRALASSLDSGREQHRASELIEPFLGRRKNGSIVIFLTASDIYTGKLNFIFGLALPSRGAGIVSIYRLTTSDRSVLLDRLVKEIVHEIGHIFGLEHCPNPECVMRFSNTLTHTDQKNREFCSNCTAKLSASYR